MDRIEAAVNHYIKHYRCRSSEEMAHYAQLPSFDVALEQASYAMTSVGTRHPHQRRLTKASLSSAHHILQQRSAELTRAESFDCLLRIVEDVAASVQGLGELYAYDTALRIGAFLGQPPKKVYLHAGTRAGAKVLGFDPRVRAVYLHQLPSPFLRLTPAEAEDVLCIYKGLLAADSRVRLTTR